MVTAVTTIVAFITSVTAPLSVTAEVGAIRALTGTTHVAVIAWIAGAGCVAAMTTIVAPASTVAASVISIAATVGASTEVAPVRALTGIAHTFAIARVARAADVTVATHSTTASS